jgi:hypothetical protein
MRGSAWPSACARPAGISGQRPTACVSGASRTTHTPMSMSNTSPTTSNSTPTSAPMCAATARDAGACGDGRMPTHSAENAPALSASKLQSTGTAVRVSRYRGWIDLSVVPDVRFSPPAEKRPCMNEHVLTRVCALLARGSRRYPLRWKARRRRCSPSCSPTLHDTRRPSRASQASSTRNRPHQAKTDRVRLCLRVYLRAYLRFCLRVKNRTPGRRGNCCK